LEENSNSVEDQVLEVDLEVILEVVLEVVDLDHGQLLDGEVQELNLKQEQEQQQQVVEMDQLIH